MPPAATEERLHLGFLRVISTEHGFVGGLLVTNHMGRPLEFQCTTPVRPNRTQEILYGQTLEPFLYSELIGKTLLDRMGIKPQLIVTQQPQLLDLRPLVDCPVVSLIDPRDAAVELPDQTCVSLGQQHAQLHASFPEDETRLAKMQSRISAEADFLEPLDRVRDALLETLRAGAAA